MSKVSIGTNITSTVWLHVTCILLLAAALVVGTLSSTALAGEYETMECTCNPSRNGTTAEYLGEAVRECSCSMTYILSASSSAQFRFICMSSGAASDYEYHTVSNDRDTSQRSGGASCKSRKYENFLSQSCSSGFGSGQESKELAFTLTCRNPIN